MRKHRSKNKRLGVLAAIFVSCLFLIGLSTASAELVTAYTFEPGTELKDVAVMLGGDGVMSDDLTCTGNCTLTTGVFGQGIELGLLDYLVTQGWSIDLDPGPNGFTIALYTKGIEFGSVGGHIVTKYRPESGWGIVSDIDPLRIEGQFSDAGTHRTVRESGDSVSGSWRHVAVTLQADGTAKLYIDGELKVTEYNVGFSPGDIRLYFGVASHAPGQANHAYGGIFDDIGIFNESLSADDIRRLSEEGLEAFMGYTPKPSAGNPPLKPGNPGLPGCLAEIATLQAEVEELTELVEELQSQPPSPVPQTGQTKCYNTSGIEIPCAGTGQDGEFQNGLAWPSERFIDNLDGTVTDKFTGLIWLQDANCFLPTVWYAGALTKSKALASGQCGLSDGSIAGDWRLPNVRELHSLIDFRNLTPALPSGHPFTAVQPGVYWTSTSYAEGNWFDGAWGVFLGDGTVYPYTYGYSAYVWPVRGGN